MRKQLALFDFDGTMIKGDSIVALVRKQFRDGLINLPELLKILWQTFRWELGLLDVETVKSQSLSGLRKLSGDKINDFLRSFTADSLYPRIYPKALEALQLHKAQGHVVILVSASPLCYLQHLQELLPVNHIIATKTDEQFKVTTNVVKDEKNKQILNWVQENQFEIDWSKSYAYGDSANDLPMLSMVGHPVLVNPHTKARRMKPEIKVEHWS